MKRPKNVKILPDKFAFVGGFLEPGESLKMAAVREVMEEISIKINPEDLKLSFAIVSCPNPSQHTIMIIFDYVVNKNKILSTLKLKTDEVASFDFMDKEMIVKNLDNFTPNIKKYYENKFL